MSGSSPGLLLPPLPKRGKGVRRLNRVPLYIGGGAIAAVVLVVAYSYQQRLNRSKAEAAAAEVHDTVGSASYAKDVIVQPKTRPLPASTGAPPGQPTTQRDVIRTAPAQTTSSPDPGAEAQQRAWAAYYQQQAQLAQAKLDAQTKAMTADTDVTPASGSSGGVPGIAGPAPGAIGGTGGLPVAGVDSTAQAEKRAFLAQGGDPFGLNEDLPATLHAPKLDTIMQGTPIPGVGVGGLTSDQPGMVIGQVSENVYDTATGDDLLIPFGSRVVGSYDNSVSNGQERIGVIWTRIIFPDTSSIQLGAMEGADQGGYAGEHDLVDKHWLEKFLSATLISIGGAAAQLSQPQQSALSGYSPTSSATAALSQQYSQLAQEQARAGLSIPNTLIIRPGYRFTIMVNKDMHLPVYVDHRDAAVAHVSTGPILQ